MPFGHCWCSDTRHSSFLRKVENPDLYAVSFSFLNVSLKCSRTLFFVRPHTKRLADQVLIGDQQVVIFIMGCTLHDAQLSFTFLFLVTRCSGESWAAKQLQLPLCPVGNGNPLQCSCLENPRDGGAWWAAVYGVTQSRTRLKQLSSSSSSKAQHRTGAFSSSTNNTQLRQSQCKSGRGWNGG